MIIFPMAGQSKRFSQKGYAVPKFMLPLWGGHVFDFAVSSFAPVFADVPFLFIYRESGNVRPFLDARVAALGISDARFIKLEQMTGGQAETVALGVGQAGVPDDAPLTIFNIDTFRNPRASPIAFPSGQSGWLEVFRGAGENWSFVRPSAISPGFADETAEKVAISDLCSTGLYHFASAALFRQAFDQERKKPSAAELYIAPVYNHLIRDGHLIGYGLVAQQDLVFCGVPDEYETLIEADDPWQGVR